MGQRRKIAPTIPAVWPAGYWWWYAEPKIVTTPWGARILRWGPPQMHRPVTVEADPVEALRVLVDLDFRDNEAVLDVARGYGPFLNLQPYGLLWDFPHAWQAYEETLPPQQRERLGRVQDLLDGFAENQLDGVDLKRIEGITRRLRIAALRGVGLGGDGDIVDGYMEPWFRRCWVELRVSGTKEGAPEPFVLGAPDPPAGKQPAGQAANLWLVPYGGSVDDSGGSIAWAVVGLMRLAMQGKRLRRCATCERTFLPETQHPDARYCRDKEPLDPGWCQRQARNEKRSRKYRETARRGRKG